MENRASKFVLLTIAVALALQCVSADVNANVDNHAALNNSATVNPKSEAPASVSPAADLAPSSALPPAENIAKTNAPNHTVEIEVYYEALCSDSVKFVSDQLLPTFDKLSNFINVTFIPFAQGNITTNPDKTLNFTCRRDEECAADRVHACGIHKINDSEKLIKFVNCSLTEGYNSSNKTVPIGVCGKNSNIDNAVITEITNCANGTESYPWLQDYMNKSSAAQVKYVPKVLINKNSTEDFKSTLSFLSAVCKQIPVESQPKDCKNALSGSDTLVVGVLPIIISAFYIIKMI